MFATKEDLKTSRFDVVNYLETEDEIQAYLEAAAEDGDVDELLEAINIAAKARGIAELAKKMGVNRTSLYKSLNGSVKPSFETVSKALACFGLRFSISKK